MKNRGKIIFFLALIVVSAQFAISQNEPITLSELTPYNLTKPNNASLSSFAITSIADEIVDDDAVLGDPNAPVTIVEFGDFFTYYSWLFWNNTFPLIKTNYIDTGKVKYVFRDFPLEHIEPLDAVASEAAECVGEQGGDAAYFQMYTALYSVNEIVTYEIFNELALSIGYNISDCLDSNSMSAEVTYDKANGFDLGVYGTPWFFINNQQILGAQNYSFFQQAIEEELNKTVACFNNNQCNDSNPYTFDTCVNPGKLNATCKHQSIRCLKNSDCGNNTSIKYCNAQGNSCFSSTSYSCNNPGTPQASCTTSASGSCSGCPFGCNNQTFMCKPTPIINLYSPLNRIYNQTSIQFNLTIGNYSFSEISYIDWSDTRLRWNPLCRNCNEYGLKRKIMKLFDEGIHNITFRAANGSKILTKNVSFFIDSKDPKISSTLPRSGFTNGSNFYIKYSESNCNSLRINIYGNNSASSGGSSCGSGTNIERFISQNLASYNNQEIEYQFVIKDIANNTAESRRTRVKIDTTKPVINTFANITNGRRVTFILNITELNFDEVNYIDYNATRPTIRRLCSSLRNGICSSTKTFSSGYHNITITVLDKAGNSVQRGMNFFV